MNVHKLVSFVFIFMFSNLFVANAHDSNSHKAPWKACENKFKTEQCSYTNGDRDLFKGTCQTFSDVLMCVRNQPIIRAEDLLKRTHKVKGVDGLKIKVSNKYTTPID